MHKQVSTSCFPLSSPAHSPFFHAGAVTGARLSAYSLLLHCTSYGQIKIAELLRYGHAPNKNMPQTPGLGCCLSPPSSVQSAALAMSFLAAFCGSRRPHQGLPWSLIPRPAASLPLCVPSLALRFKTGCCWNSLKHVKHTHPTDTTQQQPQTTLENWVRPKYILSIVNRKSKIFQLGSVLAVPLLSHLCANPLTSMILFPPYNGECSSCCIVFVGKIVTFPESLSCL